ncbi:hypothetical protein [Hymenobacter mucosus]|uniref:Uncharacterized protein n=1 Tax=Hymenobacter mucosus TaxID=1411120 RepID=A0A239A8D1_9BACT|nr:hypothetical protein [Hymenobacter mucosus]SNR91916.1 hypothetical protein SAMN06269173_11161 [Hymenobacter mucosus]
MTLDELKDKTTAELSTRLHHLAIPVLEAKKKYDALRLEQALCQSARELHTDGVWIGDFVRTQEKPSITYQVQLSATGHAQLQPVVRGKGAGAPLLLWEVGRIEKIDAA